MQAPPPTVLCFKCGQSGTAADAPSVLADRSQHMHYCACSPCLCFPSTHSARRSYQSGFNIMCDTSDVPMCHCTPTIPSPTRVCQRHQVPSCYMSVRLAQVTGPGDCTLAPSQWQTKPAEAPAARPTPPPAPSTPAANCTSTQGTPAHRSGEFGGYSRGTDAQRPGEGPLQQRPKGCYKCGKSGGGPRSLTCML